MTRIGVLASGSGTNLQAILDACAAGTIPAQVAVVVVNVPAAPAKERALKSGVPVVTIDHREFASRAAFDTAVLAALELHQVEIVCLAGFLRLLSPLLIEHFKNKILNIHPALLPSWPGLHAQRQALEGGARFAGVTVHLVDSGTDTGPILLQAVVPVLPSDTEEQLSMRLRVLEHRLYPEAIRLVAEGRVRIEGRRAILDGAHWPAEEAALWCPSVP